MRPWEARRNSCTSQLRCAGSRYPDQQQRPVNVSLQRLQEFHHLLAGDSAFVETEVEIVERQPGHRRRDEVVLQHGRLPAGRPGAAAVRPLAYARLVDEDDRAPLFLGFFLAAGSCATPPLGMLSSLRSRARPTGRCGLLQDLPDVSGMVGDAELLLDQPCDAPASTRAMGFCASGPSSNDCSSCVNCSAQTRLAPGATRMSQRLGAALKMGRAADALLRDAETPRTGGDSQAQGSQAAAFDSEL